MGHSHPVPRPAILDAHPLRTDTRSRHTGTTACHFLPGHFEVAIENRSQDKPYHFARPADDPWQIAEHDQSHSLQSVSPGSGCTGHADFQGADRIPPSRRASGECEPPYPRRQPPPVWSSASDAPGRNCSTSPEAPSSQHGGEVFSKTRSFAVSCGDCSCGPSGSPALRDSWISSAIPGRLSRHA